MTSNRKVDINVASAEDFESLIGVGRSKAEAIIESRRSLGGFSSVEDLTKVPGIGTSVIEQNKSVLSCSSSSSSRSSSSSSSSTSVSRNSSPAVGSSSNNSSGSSTCAMNKNNSNTTPGSNRTVQNLHTCASCGNAIRRPMTVTATTAHIPAGTVRRRFHSNSDNEDDDQSISTSPRSSRNSTIPAKGIMKRKSDSGTDGKSTSPGKKLCRTTESINHSLLTACIHNYGTVKTTENQLPRRRLSSRVNPPPPDLNEWLKTFQSWSAAQRLMALDELINRCDPSQVRHVMSVIEPQFQRDFISLLPRELALYVLSFLEPRDLLRAAQTCQYWRILCEDNLLWREKCRETGIEEVNGKQTRRRSNSGVPRSPWKSAFMRQHQIEYNWRFGEIKSPKVKVLKGHDDHVITCLQFCGQRIVSGSDDNTLKVWSATTGKCLRTLVGHTGGVWSSQMSNNIIISGSTDRTLKVWNADTGQCMHTLYGHTSTVRCMCLHANKVVSGSRDATLRVWNIDTGQCLHVLMGHVAAVRCVQYDGRRVVSGAYDYMVKVWNPETEECLHTLQGHTNRVYSLQFDGVHIVSGSLDTSIRVWDVESGECKHTLMGHQSLTSGMELKDNILVSGNADSTVKIWDIQTGQCLQTLQGTNKHQSAVTCLQFNKKFVITSSDDGTVKIWDLNTGEFIRNLVTLESGGSGGVVWRIRASQTKLVCAVGSRNGTEETKLLVLDFDVDEKKL
ncbi:F-box/WD repeat-containing protein 7-like [Glandiceps talaboti]